MSCNNINPITGGSTVSDIPFYLAVQQGKVPGYSIINKFGYNSSIGSGAFETIWEPASNIIFQTSAQTLSVVSSSANDVAAGTGARTLRIQGLDSSFNLLETTITLTGTTPVVTTGIEFIRVFRMSVETAGSTGNNVGNITATYSSTTNTAAYIDAANGQTLMTVYTVPNGYTGYLLSLNVSSGKDQEMTFKVITRDNTITDAGFQTKQYLEVRGGLTYINFPDGGAYGEKTDIQVTGLASSTSSASATFDLLLVQDGY